VAHVLVWLLRRHARRDACFVPLSFFASGAPSPWDGLVVVSQELSPNARLALADPDRADATVVITAVPGHRVLRRRNDAFVVSHPARDESKLLVRVCGPAGAMVASTRFVEALMALDGEPSSIDLDALPARLDVLCNAPGLAVTGDLAIVTEEATAPVAHALRWKWLEAVASCDPPCWDVLQFAHGPWQYACERPLTLVTLEHSASPLFDLLVGMLSPAHHTVLRLRALLPPPSCFIELDAMFTAVVDASLPASGRDLEDWPGRGTDGPLYDLGR
jgi:creatinine amidohydrolase